MSTARQAIVTRLLVTLFACLGAVSTACHRVDRNADGVVVDQVAASVAATLGLATGDRILAYDDKRVSSPAGLQATIENTVGKTAVELRVRRGDVNLTLTVPPGDLGADTRFELTADALKSYVAGRAVAQALRFEEAASKWTAVARETQEAGDTGAAAWLHELIGRMLENQQQWEPARSEHSAAWTLLARSKDAAAQALVLTALGRCSRNVNDLERATQWFTQASQVSAAAGYELWSAQNLNELGLVALARSEPAAARAYHATEVLRPRTV